jgi:hypothetical protein
MEGGGWICSVVKMGYDVQDRRSNASGTCIQARSGQGIEVLILLSANETHVVYIIISGGHFIVTRQAGWSQEGHWVGI